MTLEFLEILFRAIFLQSSQHALTLLGTTWRLLISCKTVFQKLIFKSSKDFDGFTAALAESISNLHNKKV